MSISGAGEEAPILYLNLEGNNLGRNGTLSLLQLYMPQLENVYLLDIYTLQSSAFTTVGSDALSSSLKKILEGTGFSKAFWDCRGDSDALFSHHNVRLDPSAVVDVQLLDLATTEDKRSRRKLKGLNTAVKCRIHLPAKEEKAWIAAKDEGGQIVESGPNWRVKIEQNVAKANSLFERSDGRPGELTALKEADLVEDGWDEAVAWE